MQTQYYLLLPLLLLALRPRLPGFQGRVAAAAAVTLIALSLAHRMSALPKLGMPIAFYYGNPSAALATLPRATPTLPPSCITSTCPPGSRAEAFRSNVCFNVCEPESPEGEALQVAYIHSRPFQCQLHIVYIYINVVP